MLKNTQCCWGSLYGPIRLYGNRRTRARRGGRCSGTRGLRLRCLYPAQFPEIPICLQQPCSESPQKIRVQLGGQCDHSLPTLAYLLLLIEFTSFHVSLLPLFPALSLRKFNDCLSQEGEKPQHSVKSVIDSSHIQGRNSQNHIWASIDAGIVKNVTRGATCSVG